MSQKQIVGSTSLTRVNQVTGVPGSGAGPSRRSLLGGAAGLATATALAGCADAGRRLPLAIGVPNDPQGGYGSHLADCRVSYSMAEAVTDIGTRFGPAFLGETSVPHALSGAQQAATYRMPSAVA